MLEKKKKMNDNPYAAPETIGNRSIPFDGPLKIIAWCAAVVLPISFTVVGCYGHYISAWTGQEPFTEQMRSLAFFAAGVCCFQTVFIRIAYCAYREAER